MRKALRTWRNACLAAERKNADDFDPHDLWIGLRLSGWIFKRQPDAVSAMWSFPAERSIALVRLALQCLEAYCDVRKDLAPDERALCDDLADKLDLALDRVYFQITRAIHARRFRTKNTELVLGNLNHEIGSGPDAEIMLRHIQKHFQHLERFDDGTLDSENTISRFAWDVYHRVATLDRLADEFPDHLRFVAREMNAWPMLRYPHTGNDARFSVLAERLELGADYPLDTRSRARFRPDSPMVRYLDALMPRVSFVRSCCRRHNVNSARDVVHWWRVDQPVASEEPALNDEAVEALRRLKDLPSLTKSTAGRWSRAVIIPLILATDARGTGPYADRAIEQIRKQRDIKSRAMFVSRLESKVRKTLQSLARPG